MERVGILLALGLGLGLSCVVTVSAAELPTRKSGLWEITTVREGHNFSIKQCVDAATDQAMQANSGPVPQRSCSKRDVERSGDTMTIDSVCTIAGKTSTHHTVIKGSFDSGYTMTLTTEGEGIPAARTITMTARWIGPCAADQKPGDMIMPNGTKTNLIDMQRRAGAPGAPPAPAGAAPR
jgi:hypothetical protein